MLFERNSDKVGCRCFGTAAGSEGTLCALGSPTIGLPSWAMEPSTRRWSETLKRCAGRGSRMYAVLVKKFLNILTFAWDLKKWLIAERGSSLEAALPQLLVVERCILADLLKAGLVRSGASGSWLQVRFLRVRNWKEVSGSGGNGTADD